MSQNAVQGFSYFELFAKLGQKWRQSRPYTPQKSAHSDVNAHHSTVNSRQYLSL